MKKNIYASKFSKNKNLTHSHTNTIATFKFILIFMISLFSQLKTQGQCNSNPATFETCDTTYTLYAATLPGYDYFWYSCDASSNNQQQLSMTPQSSYVVNSLTNNTLYFVYKAVDTVTQAISCTSGVILLTFDNTFDIQSNNATPATFSAQYYSTFVTYSNFQWNKNGQPIANANSNTYTTSTSGLYSLDASSTCGNRTSNSISYHAPNNQCSQNTPVYLSCDTSYVLSFNPAVGYDVTWYSCDAMGANASILKGGVASNSLTVYTSVPSSNSVNYYYYVCTDIYSNATCTSALITLEFEPQLLITANASTPPTLSIQSSSSLIGYTSLQWYDQNGIITGANSNTYTVTKSGNYFVTATSPTCGFRTSNTLTYAPNNVQCNTTRIVHYTCDTIYSLTKTPSAGYDVTWYSCDSLGNNATILYGGAAANTINVLPSTNSNSQAKHYYYICTDVFTQSTCTSAVITVVYELNLTIVGNTITLPAILSANPYSNHNSYTQYQWYRNGHIIPRATDSTFNAKIPGGYQLRATSICGNSQSNTIVYNCSTSTALVLNNYTFPTGTTVLNGEIYIVGTIKVPQNAIVNIDQARIEAESCSEIIVDSADRADTSAVGGILTINNTTLSSCNNWQGIKVYGQKFDSGAFVPQNGALTMNNSELYGALIGVNAVLHGYLYINKCLFENNFNHIRMYFCWEMNGYIDSSRFTYLMEAPQTFCYNDTMPSYYNPSKQKHIYGDYVSIVRLLNDTFECYNNNGFQSENAIQIESVQSSLNTSNLYGFKISDCKFYGDFYNGVYFKEPHYVYIDGTGESEFIGDIEQAIDIKNFTHVYIDNQKINRNIIFHNGGGIRLSSGFDAIVSNNEVNNFAKGIEFYDNGSGVPFSPLSYIKGNKINSCTIGVSSASNEFPVGNVTTNNYINDRDLKIYCNQILNCDYGIIGTGPIVDQGSASGGSGGNFEDWSNRFCDSFANHACLNGSSSVFADLVWWNQADSIQLYMDTLISFRQLKPLIDSFVLNNNPINDATNRAQFKVNFPSINQAVDFFCNGGLYNVKNEDKSWDKNISLVNMKIYPNPAVNELTIEREEYDLSLYKIEIYDILGQKKYSQMGQNINTYISTSDFSQGLYIINIQDINSFKKYSFKVIIIR